jgi:hypothetical protein
MTVTAVIFWFVLMGLAILAFYTITRYLLSPARAVEPPPPPEPLAYRLADDISVSLFEVVQAAEAEVMPKIAVEPTPPTPLLMRLNSADRSCVQCEWQTLRSFDGTEVRTLRTKRCDRHRNTI